MALRLEIVSAHRQKLGERGLKEFGRNGGTIGRSLQSDWVLPDALRYVSSRHASIDYRSGSYYIVDLSTNGVYVNGSDQPVGRGNPQRLFDGDRLRFGDYEIRVSIDEEDEAVAIDGKHIDPVDLAQRVETPEPTYYDLVAPDELTGVGLEEILAAEEEGAADTAQVEVLELTLADDEPLGAAQAAPAAESERGRRERSSAASKPASPARAAAMPRGTAPASSGASEPRSAQKQPSARPARGNAAAPDGQGGGPLAAFFRGAGLAEDAVTEQTPEEVLHRAGQLIRELILGVTESLQIRAEQKSMLRLPNTTIQRQANNPLKFAAGIDEALNNLFFRQSPDYLSAVEAVREALRDIKQHQQLLLGALPTAVADYIGRLDPEELEQKFAGGKRGALLNAANKLRYWDLYKDLYQVVANHTAGQLPPQFAEEFARVYEEALTRTAAAKAAAKQAS